MGSLLFSLVFSVVFVAGRIWVAYGGFVFDRSSCVVVGLRLVLGF